MNKKRTDELLFSAAVVFLLIIGYVIAPSYVKPRNLLEIRISDIRPRMNGMIVDFIIIIVNKGIWPLILNDLKWDATANGIPIAVRFIPFPETLSIMPFQSIQLSYTIISLFFQLGFTQDYIRSVNISLSGTINAFAFSNAFSLTEGFQIDSPY